MVYNRIFRWYPLVTVYITNWKSTMLLINGKTHVISTGWFSIAMLINQMVFGYLVIKRSEARGDIDSAFWCFKRTFFQKGHLNKRWISHVPNRLRLMIYSWFLMIWWFTVLNFVHEIWDFADLWWTWGLAAWAAIGLSDLSIPRCWYTCIPKVVPPRIRSWLVLSLFFLRRSCMFCEQVGWRYLVFLFFVFCFIQCHLCSAKVRGIRTTSHRFGTYRRPFVSSILLGVMSVKQSQFFYVYGYKASINQSIWVVYDIVSSAIVISIHHTIITIQDHCYPLSTNTMNIESLQH